MARKPHQKRDLYAEVTDRIVARLEQGVAPWACPWRRDGDGGSPRNGASGHRYRGVNLILTAMSGFGTSRWYTFRQAKALGGHVRRGEKATPVIYWRFVEVEAKDGEKARKVPFLRHYNVFNAEQIEWPESSDHAPSDGGEDVDFTDGFEDAASLVDASGAEITHGGIRAFYAPAEDAIRLPSPERFEAPEHYWGTALHELAHWSGHEGRLARDLTGRFGSESYAAEELVAELASAYLAADLGIPGHLQHAEYIGSWIKVLQGDKRAIFTASRLAQEAADDLLHRAGRLDDQEAHRALEAA